MLVCTLTVRSAAVRARRPRLCGGISLMCMTLGPMDLLPFVGTLAVGALGGAIAGSIITQVMTNARDRRAQHVAFLKQQLEQFYGALFGSSQRNQSAKRTAGEVATSTR